MMLRAASAGLVAAAFSAGSLYGQPLTRPAHVREELICERPAKDHFGPPWTEVAEASRDMTKVVWMSRRGGPWVVAVNGEALGPAADEGSPWAWALHPDGRVLRAGRNAKNWLVWLDGQQVAGPFESVRGVQWTPDGKPAFVAKRGGAWTWVVDGKEQAVTTPEPGHFKASGSRVAYGVKLPDGWHMVIDGQTGPPFISLVDSAFSRDGTRFAYIGFGKEGMVAVVDGKAEPARAAAVSLSFSPDSKRLAYVAVDTPKTGAVGQVVVDGKAGRAFPALVQNLEDEISAALGNLRMYGFWNPPELKPHVSGVSAPVFRSDGKLVYAGRVAGAKQRFKTQGGGVEMISGLADKGQEGIFVEGEEKPLHPASMIIQGPILSEDGRHVAWVELDPPANRWVAYLDGQPSAGVPAVEKRFNDAYRLTLSRDGTRVAFQHLAAGSGFARGTATHALRRAVATGLPEDKAYDAENLANLRFSEDGRHLAYEVHRAKGFEPLGGKYGSFVVVDGVPGRVYANVVLDSMRFTGPGTVSYVARVQEVKDGPYRYYRVTQTLPAKP